MHLLNALTDALPPNEQEGQNPAVTQNKISTRKKLRRSFAAGGAGLTMAVTAVVAVGVNGAAATSTEPPPPYVNGDDAPRLVQHMGADGKPAFDAFGNAVMVDLDGPPPIEQFFGPNGRVHPIFDGHLPEVTVPQPDGTRVVRPADKAGPPRGVVIELPPHAVKQLRELLERGVPLPEHVAGVPEDILDEIKASGRVPDVVERVPNLTQPVPAR